MRFIIIKKKIYKGFLFDSRVADDCWVRAKVYNFHDDDDTLYKLFWLDEYEYTGILIDIMKTLRAFLIIFFFYFFLIKR